MSYFRQQASKISKAFERAMKARSDKFRKNRKNSKRKQVISEKINYAE
jgi:hypothetical protein